MTSTIIPTDYRNFLNTSLDVHNLREKNRNAPYGVKFCNAFCQKYCPYNIFTNKSSICGPCRNKINLATSFIKKKKITLEQFKNNPEILYNKPPENLNKKTCASCNETKSIDMFEGTRNYCKSCRYLESVARREKGIDLILEDIKKKQNNLDVLQNFLISIPKEKLAKIISILKIGRKSTDTKDKMISNTVEHYRKLLNPFLCKGGCGQKLPTQFKTCDECQNKEKNILRIKTTFDDNIDSIVEELDIITTTTIDNYNLAQYYKIATKMNIKYSTNTNKYDLIDLINNKIKEKQQPAIKSNIVFIDDVEEESEIKPKNIEIKEESETEVDSEEETEIETKNIEIKEEIKEETENEEESETEVDSEEETEIETKNIVKEESEIEEESENEVENENEEVESENEEVENKEEKKKISKEKRIIQPEILKLNGIEIITRKEDGYINATSICKAGGKELKNWVKTDKTSRFLQVLSSSVKIITNELIKYELCSNDKRATWVHPQVAINIAQWISAEFDVQVSKWIFELRDSYKTLKQENTLLHYQIEEFSNKTIITQPGILNLNGAEIIARKKDGYINATSLCKAGNKKFNDWCRLDKTQKFLAEFTSLISSTGNPANELIKYESGSNDKKATWVHPQVAINIAQWISAKFDVQVSKWIFELMLTGKVELGKEKTQIQLQTELVSQRIRIDTRPYSEKAILYCFEFKPVEEYMKQPELLEDTNLHFFKFGVTDDINERQSSHGNDYRLDKCFIYKSRNEASLGEKYLKYIVSDMDLKFFYKKSLECMMCSYDKLEEIYKIMEEHSNYNNVLKSNQDININGSMIECDKNTELEIQKLRLEEKKLDNEQTLKERVLELFSNGKITFEEMQKLVKF